MGAADAEVPGNGRFELDPLEPGTYTIVGVATKLDNRLDPDSPEQLRSATQLVNLPAGGNIEVSLVLQ